MNIEDCSPRYVDEFILRFLGKYGVCPDLIENYLKTIHKNQYKNSQFSFCLLSDEKIIVDHDPMYDEKINIIIYDPSGNHADVAFEACAGI